MVLGLRSQRRPGHPAPNARGCTHELGPLPRDPDLDPAWRGDDEEHDERECARQNGDCACIPMPSLPSPEVRAIDEHRRRVEWSNPLAVWPRD